MKRDRGPIGLLGLAAAVAAAGVVLFGLFGCAHHGPRQPDWRNPPRACTSDRDCHHGDCVIELGASQGTCARGPAPPPGAGEDGGSRAPRPGPSIQPSSSDIQL